ncbi:hypothetical protein [Pseudonocardia nigra]|uniref:hypothetical protein n=1 Tax=Pseudonocardia nigra TaxID=1921578 RepID=UPI001C5F54FE|nr:hypothetical protein [Pseudonocardia nigra]
MTGDRPLWLGLLLYLSITAAPTLMFWAALKLQAVVAARRVRAAPGVGPPLESRVADVRRLRRAVRHGPRRNRLRRVALLSAYDDVLVDLCAAIGVDSTPLTDAAETGSGRAFARLQVEAAVEEAGIALDPPTGDTAAA